MNTYVPSDHGQQSNTTERNAQPIQNSNQIKEKLKFSEQPRRKEEINNRNKDSNDIKSSWFTRDGRVENYQQKRETESLIQEHLDYLHKNRQLHHLNHHRLLLCHQVRFLSFCFLGNDFSFRFQVNFFLCHYNFL